MRLRFRSPDRFQDDTRGIEGLPIRLVIALVVGVASLSIMMSMLSGIGGLGMTELDVEPEPEVLTAGTEQEVTITAVDHDGAPVADATIVLTGASAQLSDGVQTVTTDEDGQATVTLTPELDANQQQGNIEIDIKPPAGSDYVDKRENTPLLVINQ